MTLQATPTTIPEVLLLKPDVHLDDRGFLLERYKQTDYERLGIPAMVQFNQVRSTRGVIRGLHWQCAPHAQGKLVSVVRGSIFDVAVDLRQGARTFGQWVGVELDDVSHHQLWVPPGFGHGYLVLSEEADVTYAMTTPYSPEAERGVRWNDPDLAIDWPMPTGVQPLVSPRDAALPLWEDLGVGELFSSGQSERGSVR